LVITGDPSGYLWICSVWSSVSNTESITPVIEKVLPGILEKFIHQQGSGRCLVFLVLLGHLCEKLAAEYENILKRLDRIMEIGVSDGIQIRKPPTPAYRLVLGESPLGRTRMGHKGSG
jgi:hypothetical protein